MKKKGNKQIATTASPMTAMTVGDTVVISREETDKIKSLENIILGAQINLASLRENYLREETEYVDAVARAREAYVAAINDAGLKYGVNLGSNTENYDFNVASGTFTRTR